MAHFFLKKRKKSIKTDAQVSTYAARFWAVVLAQSVEQSLRIPEVRGLNPVIGKHLY